MSSWSEIPQDISLMPTPLAINNLTITRIIVHLLGDEEEGNQEEGEPMRRLRQRLKDNPQAQEAVAREAKLHLHLLYL